jgi:hypothetical protein
MQKILAMHMVSAVAQLERVEVLLTERKKMEGWDHDAEVPANIRNYIASQFSALTRSAEAMGANVTAKTANIAAAKLRRRKKGISAGDLAELNRQLRSVLSLEFDDVELYCLNAGSSAFYSPKAPLFGQDVEARIPKANDDISEAGKCFATARYTASVFHLMRAMEAAVRALTENLGIDNIEREWGKLLSDIGKKVEEMPKGAVRNDWSQAHANLYHVKQAWRN